MNGIKKPLSVLIAASCLYAATASAELYVSPVVRNSVTYGDVPTAESLKKKAPAKKVIKQAAPVKKVAKKAAKPAKVIRGNSSVHGDFVMNEEAKEVSTTAVLRYGKNVPLFVAIENLIPKKENWKFNIEENLKNTPVSWKGGESWEEVLQVIAKANKLYIYVNKDEKVIGVSRIKEIAVHSAKKVSQVWVMNTSKTLRENIAEWARRAGWKLEWRCDIDYPISHSATLTGEFSGENGVIDQTLRSLKNEAQPLKAKFYSKNSVLLITNHGFEEGEVK